MLTYEEFAELPVENHWGDGLLIKAVRRYWLVVTFDFWSDDDDWFGNTLFAYVDGEAGYELWGPAMVFESYTEALAEANVRTGNGYEWFAINMADDARRDRTVPQEYMHLMEFEASKRAFAAKERNRLSRVPTPS